MLNFLQEFEYPKVAIDLLKPYDMPLIITDYSFIALSLFVFYKIGFGFIIAIPLIYLLFKRTRRYHKTNEVLYTKSFVDFLNLMNSNLSAGTTFEKCILNMEPLKHMCFAVPFEKLKTIIKMGAPTHKISEVMFEIFPIQDAKLYTDMITWGLTLGVNPSYITSKSIHLIAYKQQVISEMNRVIYQKKLEQTILVFAPLGIILFIMASSPSYLEVLYTTGLGRLVMSFSLLLIITMKIVSEKIVKFEVK